MRHFIIMIFPIFTSAIVETHEEDTCCEEFLHLQHDSSTISHVIQEEQWLGELLLEAWHHAEQFLAEGRLIDGEQATNLSNQFESTRRICTCCRSEQTTCCMDEACISSLGQIQSFLKVTGTIFELLVNDNSLINFRNNCMHLLDTYFSTYDYDSGEEALKTLNMYKKLQKISSEIVRNLPTRVDLNPYLSYSWARTFLSKKIGEDLQFPFRTEEDRLVYDLEVEDIVKKYVDMSMNVVIVLIGVFLNGVLILIFALNKEVRKPMNIMIFNMAVSDIFNIVTNVPLYYVYTYYKKYLSVDELECKMIYNIRLVGIYVGAFSVVGLSIQRFWGIHSQFGNSCCKSQKWIGFWCATAVWAFSIGLCAFYSSVMVPKIGYCFNRATPYSGIPQDVARHVELVYLLLFCFISPIVVAVASILTARKLNTSARSMPGEVRESWQKHARYRSARVVTVLAVVFAISNMPRSIWFFVLLWAQPRLGRITYLCLDRVTYYLRFSNPCFNPIALYVASRRFRRLFQYYLFKCPRCAMPKISKHS